MHISSLPGDFGIGAFSQEAYDFVDMLKKAGQSFWQILPLGPTGFGNSPYQSFSTFAGNPYFIDLKELYRLGYLCREDYEGLDFSADSTRVDYGK
ncbi:MAG: 4-alpha-glucanotransferase, partial [Eubacterium sp.]